jgi:hypothetical protein
MLHAYYSRRWYVAWRGDVLLRRIDAAAPLRTTEAIGIGG